MRLAVLSGGNGFHVRDLLRAAREIACEPLVFDFTQLRAMVSAGRNSFDGIDAVVVRTMPLGSLEQVIFRMDVLHALEARGVPILNPPRSLEVCIDKYLTTVKLADTGLLVPPTIVCQTTDDALAAFAELGGDVVVKPLFGSEGRGMVRVTDPETAWRVFRAVERTQSVHYLQAFIRHPGWDIRAFVLQGRILAAMQRKSRGDWRTNVAQGGYAIPYHLTSDEEEIAIRAARTVGTIAAGVDLLPGPNGERFVIEVNAVPGWRALAPVTGVDIAKELLLAVMQRGK